MEDSAVLTFCEHFQLGLRGLKQSYESSVRNYGVYIV